MKFRDKSLVFRVLSMKFRDKSLAFRVLRWNDEVEKAMSDENQPHLYVFGVSGAMLLKKPTKYTPFDSTVDYHNYI